jgi:hypothetical protein
MELPVGDETQVVESNDTLLVTLAVIAVVIVLFGVLYAIYRRTRTTRAASKPTPAGTQALIDSLIRQIADLDARHEAGELDDASYQRQRRALKAGLATLMEGK